MRKKNYLNNGDLYTEICISKQQDKPTDKLYEFIILLVENISKKFTYNDNTIKDDCKQDAILHLILNYHNFNEEKYTNAFAYMTEIGKRAYGRSYTRIMQKDKCFMKGITFISVHSEAFENYDL